MCMKYINTNIQCFDNSFSQYWLGNGALSSFIDRVKSSKDDKDKYKVEKFGIAVFINIRGSKSDARNNPLEQKKKLEFKIRLTRLSKNSQEQLSYDLSKFVIDLSDANLIKRACFDYVDIIKTIYVNDLELESAGDYVIKVLIKEESAKLFDIQMVHHLSVCES